ncbi:MAG: hypothetical protein K6G10_02680 [Butyrivibrio sp.]|nr:hypothetical protein [Butyrivibrio sp.]
MSRDNKLEKIRYKNNAESMKMMGEDAVLAKTKGVSYGRYKANMGPVFEATDYPISTQEHMTRSEEKPKEKTLAFIK